MTRFQLVFQYPDGARSEIREHPNSDEPRINGELIVDGHVYILKEIEWIIRREDINTSVMPRYVCSLVVESTDGDGSHRM